MIFSIHQRLAVKWPLDLRPSPGTPSPPGTPLLWFDGADFNGSKNAGITQGDTLTAWVNKGSVGASGDLIVGGAPVTFDATDGIQCFRKADSTDGGFRNTTHGTFATGDFTYAIIFRVDAWAHFRRFFGLGSNGGSPHTHYIVGATFGAGQIQENMTTAASLSTVAGDVAQYEWNYMIFQRRETVDFKLIKLSDSAGITTATATTSRLFDRGAFPGDSNPLNGSPFPCRIAQFAAWAGYDPAAPTVAQLEAWCQSAIGQTMPLIGSP